MFFLGFRRKCIHFGTLYGSKAIGYLSYPPQTNHSNQKPTRATPKKRFEKMSNACPNRTTDGHSFAPQEVTAALAMLKGLLADGKASGKRFRFANAFLVNFKSFYSVVSVFSR